MKIENIVVFIWKNSSEIHVITTSHRNQLKCHLHLKMISITKYMYIVYNLLIVAVNGPNSQAKPNSFFLSSPKWCLSARETENFVGLLRDRIVDSWKRQRMRAAQFSSKLTHFQCIHCSECMNWSEKVWKISIETWNRSENFDFKLRRVNGEQNEIIWAMLIGDLW